jgi:predicted phage-related endonuclease
VETAREIEESRGFQVRAKMSGDMLRSTRWPWLFATIDAWLLVEKDGKPTRACHLQAKTRRIERWENGPPEDTLVQCQHEMAVLGTRYCYVAALIGGNELRWQRLERNEEFVERLVEVTGEFWKRIERGVPPPPLPEPGLAEVVAKLYPKTTGETIELLAPEWVELDEQYVAASAALSEVKRRKEACEEKIKAALGSAQYAVLANGTTYNWPSITQEERVIPAGTYRGGLYRRKPK